MRRLPLIAIVEAGILIALAALLSTIKIWRMPQGGSVTAGSMIPILLIGLRWGSGLGVVAGTGYGFVRYLLSGYVVHPVQFLLDYPIAFGLLGLAGLVRRHPLAGIAAGIGGRLAAHVVAGAVFFGAYAPVGQSPWVYSLLYNGSYLLPELGISILIAWLLARAGALGTVLDDRARRGY